MQENYGASMESYGNLWKTVDMETIDPRATPWKTIAFCGKLWESGNP